MYSPCDENSYEKTAYNDYSLVRDLPTIIVNYLFNNSPDFWKLLKYSQNPLSKPDLTNEEKSKMIGKSSFNTEKYNVLFQKYTTDAVVKAINEASEEKRRQNKKVGIIATEETKEKYKADYIMCIGSRKDEESIARHLYGILREFDHLQVEYIYGECFSKNNLGQAIMNRLQKAAGYQIIDVSSEERCDTDEI